MVITLLSRRVSSAAGSRRASTARTYASATWSPRRASRRPRAGGDNPAPSACRSSAAPPALLAAWRGEPRGQPPAASRAGAGGARSPPPTPPAPRPARGPARSSGGQPPRATPLAAGGKGPSPRACPADGVGAEDGPANLGPPFRLIRGVGRAAQV